VHAEKLKGITVLESLRKDKLRIKLSKDSSDKSKDISLGPKVKCWAELYDLELPPLLHHNLIISIIESISHRM